MIPGIEVEFKFELPPEIDPANFESMANEIVERTAEAAREEWVRLAGENLKGTYQSYVGGIDPKDNSPTGLSEIERPDTLKATITLRGTLPNMLEQGHDAFDIKPGILNGPHVKMGKDGSKFQDIPFIYGGPSQSLIGTKTLPKEVFKEANKMQYGERYSDKSRRKNWNMGRPGGYEHKTGIFDDLRKGAKGSVDAFRTFRRISENSDPASWIHPGLKALHLAEKVVEFLNTQVEGIAESVLGTGNK
jgi:hypothetical protein